MRSYGSLVARGCQSENGNNSFGLSALLPGRWLRCHAPCNIDAMPERLLAQINPAALTWARDVLGMPLDVAARKIGVSERKLEQLERGDAKPTITQLRAIARAYRRPTAFFYLQPLPPKPQRIEDFRAMRERQEQQTVPELLDAVEAAKQRRLTALELSSVLGHDIPSFGVAVSLNDQPEAIAEQIRERLGVSLVDQRSWRDAYPVLRNWTDAVEDAGVLVTQFSNVEVHAARGFSITDRPYPLVAINGKDSVRAKVFTLFHELAHIALGASGLCDLHDATDRADVVEPFCNQVAGEALVPAASLLAEPIITQRELVTWDDWRLQELATTYGVSAEVILRRLLTLGRTTEAFYRAKREEFLRTYEGAAANAGGFIAHFRRVLRDNGTAFTGLVLDAYHADLITPTEVSRYLGGVKLLHLPAIEGALTARAG